jgi:spore maturation protein CgeB
MRIFYTGELWEGGTCRERMLTLRGLGHELACFDTSPWTTGGNRVFRSLAHRTNCGPHVRQLNRALAEAGHALGHFDLIWVDKGRWIYRQTLAALRQRMGAKLLHYSPDAHFFDNRSRIFRDCLPLYDWVVTTKPFELDRYRSSGARETLLALQGFDPRFGAYRREPDDGTAWSSDVCFIGHYQPHYAACLKAASQVSDRLRIWGHGWPAYAARNRWARPCVSGDGAWGGDYLRALSNTRIALGLLGKHIPETTTTRSFEIPALGIFLLAERTDDHLALFEEGREAEFFGDREELKDKLRYYLANDRAREKIASSGRKRCLESGYSSAEQLANIMRAAGPACVSSR